MKLIDILVQELPKSGGWPDGADHIATNGYRRVFAYWVGSSLKGRDLNIVSDTEGYVRREQYETALAASKPGWDGEGLPPVGSECEIVDKDDLLRYGHGESGEVIAHIENTAVIRMSYGLGCFNAGFLRPIRSEADKKRDASIQEIIELIDQLVGERANPVRGKKAVAEEFYDAIEAGKIPHIRID